MRLCIASEVLPHFEILVFEPGEQQAARLHGLYRIDFRLSTLSSHVGRREAVTLPAVVPAQAGDPYAAARRVAGPAITETLVIMGPRLRGGTTPDRPKRL